MPTVQKSELFDFAETLLREGGFTAEDAKQTADLLVWANLRGMDSHGVMRIPSYIERVEQGIIRSGHSVEEVSSFGATAIIDGGKCPGSVGMNAAADRAGDLAEKFGVGWCCARNISHAGAIGYFAGRLTARGQIGIVMTASKPLMTYFGAKGEALSTNPLAIAAPRAGGADPIVLDMSTSAVALGKIMAARDAGAPIPAGWAVDAHGAETTDPHNAAALLPMAGPKGSGLSLMIEVLSSVLAGNAVIGPFLGGRKDVGYNGLVQAVNPAAFGDAEDFFEEMERLAEAIHKLEPAPGTDKVLLPGERGATTARLRTEDGILLSQGTANRLIETAERLGVTVPEVLRL